LSLIFIENKIGDEGTIVISEELKSNTSLAKLNLRCEERNSLLRKERIVFKA